MLLLLLLLLSILLVMLCLMLSLLPEMSARRAALANHPQIPETPPVIQGTYNDPTMETPVYRRFHCGVIVSSLYYGRRFRDLWVVRQRRASGAHLWQQ